MRRFVYTRLRSAPRDGAASFAFISSVWAAADPGSFSAFISHRWKALDVSATGFLVAAVLAAYVVGLWLTRHWHQSERDIYCRDLGKALDDIRAARVACVQATTDDEFRVAKAHADSVRVNIGEWMVPTMGPRAWQKFDTRFTSSHSYEWEGDHDPETSKQRNIYLDALPDYASNLEAMMQSSAWDPLETLRSRQWKQRIQTWKTKLLTVLQPS